MVLRLRSAGNYETYNELKGIADATIANSEPGTLTGDGWVNINKQPQGSESDFSDVYWSDADVSSKSEIESEDETF